MKRIFLVVTLLAVFLTRALSAAGEQPVSDLLVFDAVAKQYDAKVGEKSAPFAFFVTNTWTNEITVDRVQTSCGCTVAKLPANPWHIPAGTGGQVAATVNLEGKGAGLIVKTLTLYLSTNTAFAGTRVLTVKANNPAPPAPPAMTARERKAAMETAQADAQAIFRNSQCAECHVKQGVNQWGGRLYAADCGICHDSPNRASFVPDLHALKTPTDFNYWKSIIANGKPHTLMPAFADTAGGPLTDVQVHSIAEYLNHTIPNTGKR